MQQSHNMFEWDENKNQQNIEKHGFDFEDARDVIPENVIRITLDDRKDYTETRYNIFGKKNNREVIITATIRNGKYRIISFRKCNNREIKRFFKE
ncbi:BrnT family toxin [Allofrancisella inopinata]|nr:BrnT family toxin [Allofrancisella inopinata]